MILWQGELYEREQQMELLPDLSRQIEQTLLSEPLLPEITIAACDRLAAKAEQGAFSAELAGLDLDPALKEEQITQAIHLLRRESLEAMVQCQLGKAPFERHEINPPFYSGTIVQQRRPLGVLLHIAAGNMDGLPVFTVIEGLLAGNINLLKLPSMDNGLSVQLLLELVREEPRLAPFVYVFDTPSEDLTTLQYLADHADGIVVWGGEGAVSALRSLAPLGAKLIEWGHRLSFAYVTQSGQTEENLRGLAEHIMQTKQLLCSSCQTIFLDCDDEHALDQFSARFLPVLEEAAVRYPVRDLGAVAQGTLNRYTARLEHAAGYSTDRMVAGKGCSLTLCQDQKLALSFQYGNPLVKRLPRDQLLSELRPFHGVLQTVGLLCADEERNELIHLLTQAGLVRIKIPKAMSHGSCCDAHDGQFPLQRYTRIVEYEF